VSERRIPHVSTIEASKMATTHATKILNDSKLYTTLNEVRHSYWKSIWAEYIYIKISQYHIIDEGVEVDRCALKDTSFPFRVDIAQLGSYHVKWYMIILGGERSELSSGVESSRSLLPTSQPRSLSIPRKGLLLPFFCAWDGLALSFLWLMMSSIMSLADSMLTSWVMTSVV